MATVLCQINGVKSSAYVYQQKINGTPGTIPKADDGLYHIYIFCSETPSAFSFSFMTDGVIQSRNVTGSAVWNEYFKQLDIKGGNCTITLNITNCSYIKVCPGAMINNGTAQSYTFNGSSGYGDGSADYIWRIEGSEKTDHRTIMYYDGQKWQESIVYYFDGEQWLQCNVQYYDGSQWLPCSF